MKIILVGCGTIGKSIVSNLVKENHEITVIDNNINKVNNLINEYDISGIVGDGTDKSILKEVGINNCDLFISTTSSDEVNIVSCLIAKKIGAKHTIARVRSPHYNNETSLLENLGISLLINPEKETAEEIYKIISFSNFLQIDSFDNDINIFEFPIESNSELIGKSLKSIKKEYEAKVLFVSIDRNGTIIIPTGNDIILENDKVSLISTKEDLVDFIYAAHSKRKPLKNFLIVGGGNTTVYLLNKLNKPRYTTKVIEIDKDKCKQLAEDYDNCEIINGDGTSINTLINHGIDNCDALISLAPLDEENLITAVFATSRNVKKVILKQSRSNVATMIEQTKFASVISPKQIIADKILSYVRKLANPHGNSVVKMHKIVENKLEAIEFNIGDDCKLIDCEIRNLKLKENILIAAIIRDGKTIIPSGLNKIKLNDHIIIITKNSIDEVNEIIK